MRVSFSVLFAIFLSLDAFAAPFPNADVGNESALEVRTAKLAARKPVKQVAPKKVAKAKAPIKAAPKKKVPAKAPAKVAPKKVPTKAPAKVVPKKKVPAKAPVKVVPKKKGVPAKVPAKGKTTPVKGSPKTPTKATTGTKAPIKVPAKAPTKSAAKPSASAKPSNKPLCNAKQVEARAIEARARVRHPSATGTITLFHGANPVNAAKLANSKVNLAIGAPVGDFNHRPEVPGGFYLTDSLVAAAQFACFGIPRQRPAKVDVLQFKWTGAGVAVHEFPGETAEWNNFQLYNSNPNLVINAKSPFRALAQEIYQNAMITGCVSTCTQ
ncbi:hypothetical protein DFH09DRAFT_119914 [Mycena vulgaris]|nr:hypothetical protein DFH09DRAFT_119914 [Mycena vulgaris]